jgi:hypothetical protein
MGALGMQALHVKVSKPAVSQYGVALDNESDTGTGVTRCLPRGDWGQLWLVGQEVEAVAGRL